MAIAYSIKEAALQVGISESLMREEVRDGAVQAKYVRSKQIIEHKELVRYVASLPSERVS